jgi:hypothetical protein
MAGGMPAEEAAEIAAEAVEEATVVANSGTT